MFCLLALSNCVSKKEHLMKVEESEKLSKELSILKSDHARLQEEKKELGKTIIDQKSRISDLENENSLLKEEVQSLHAKAEALERKRDTDIRQMKGTYENLLEDMKSEIDKGQITITQLKGKLKVNMLDEILFDSGKTVIKPQGIEVLKRVGNILLEVKERAINIEGHTDNVPIGIELKKRYPTNWELSSARATNVARYLQETIGIEPSLLSATGYGEFHPIASNDTAEGKAKNRRIDIVLVPIEVTPFSRK